MATAIVLLMLVAVGLPAPAAAGCTWVGHCRGASCKTENDCDGDLVCVNGKCGSGCSWAGHCLGDPCTTDNDCDGALVCVSGKCGGSAPSPSPGPVSGCPSGWLLAVGTVFDSWPKPGTTECVAYSGCQWAGQFNNIDGGSAKPCKNGAQWLNGGGGVYACRFPESLVKSWNIAATYQVDPSLLGRKLQVMVQGAPQRTVTVNIKDVCADADCDGCCRANTGNARYKLIDIEKWPASSLLGFNPSASNFDINNVNLPNAIGLRPGAPEDSVMALCYKDMGAAV